MLDVCSPAPRNFFPVVVGHPRGKRDATILHDQVVASDLQPTQFRLIVETHYFSDQVLSSENYSIPSQSVVALFSLSETSLSG